jgi:RHS repeat-associated protein
VKGESDYYPFGAERVISSTVTDGFRFAGMEWDSEDGLNHTVYRKYTPAQARWETPDPVPGCVRNPQGHNLYSYALDNPANYADPLGLDLCPPLCTVVEQPGEGLPTCDCPPSGEQGGGPPCTNVVGAGGDRHPDLLPVCPKPPAGGGGGPGGRVNKLICGPTGHLTFDWQTFTTCLEALQFVPVAAACVVAAIPCVAAIVAAVGSGGALSPLLTICAPAAATCGVSGLILVGCGIHATHCEPNVVVRPPVKGPPPRQTWTPAAALGNQSQDPRLNRGILA